MTGLVEDEHQITAARKTLTKKFQHTPEVIDGNIKAIERAYQEVHGE